MKRKALLLFILVTILTGCTSPINETMDPTESVINYDWMAGESPVDSTRTGALNLSIGKLNSGFEYTDSGCYWMCEGILLYCDHGSDTVIRVCGRPDCTHEDLTCNAHFYMGSNVCYYDGYLYVTSDTELIRLNPDGTGRVSLMQPVELVGHGGSGNQAPMIMNGIYTVGLNRLNDDGELVIEQYYTSLDGDFNSMECTDPFIPVQTEGDSFIVVPDNEDSYVLWDVATNTFTFLTEYRGRGYYGAEEAWYIQDGVIYRLEYATGVAEAMADTGLTGGHALHAFSECLVISNFPDEQQWAAYEDVTEQTLRFYNWDFEFLGEVELDYPNATKPYNPICGETPERIFLTDNIDYIPRYYIDKSELGTGTIQLHKLELPEDIAQSLDETGNVDPALIQ